MTETRGFSRRQFLRGLGAAPFACPALSYAVGGVPAFLPSFHELAASERKRVKIRDVQVMVMQGASRTYTLIKITSDAGLYGIAEAYGSPGVGVKEQVLSLKPWLVGKDPLEIDTLYTTMGERTRDLSGTRTDGSAHNLMRAVSGIEMALWDLAGKILEVPTSTLLGGKFRDKVRLYDHAAPRNMLDKASVADWAAKVKAHPSGFTCHKFGFPNSDPATDKARDLSNRVLTTKELINVQKGFENCREAIGWDRDLMVHCHWEYDLRTSIQIAGAVESIKPVWLEDPLPVDYSDSWKRVRGIEGADLHGRKPRAPRRVQGFHPESGLRHSPSRPEEFRWLPRNQTHRRYGARVRAADGEPQHRQSGLHLRRRAMGGVDPRLHFARDDHW
jgi:L-alanine-DL-glutamate epimerase-like enolase superfamily enzyme